MKLILAALAVITIAHAAPNARSLAHRSRYDRPLGLTADIKGELEESLFAKVLNGILPTIVKDARQLTIKGEATEHFSFSSFKFSSFDISALSIVFAAPDVVRMQITGLTFSVPHTHFDVYTKILFIKATCSGDFWVSLAPSTITLDLHISTTAQGKLNFAAGSSSVTFGALSINHEFKEFLCKVGEDIIQLFIGNIDTLLRNLVEKDLPNMIAPLAEKALNGAFDKLPLVVVGAPTVTAQGITLTIDLIASLQPHARVNHVPRPPTPRHRAVHDLNRDIVLTAPQVAINNVLLYEDQIHHLVRNISIPPNVLNTSSIATLIPAVAKVCAACPVDLDVSAIVPPTVKFGNESVTVNINTLHVGLAALNGTRQLPLFSLNANLSLKVLDLTVRGDAQNVIWFQLNINDFSFAIDKSEVGPININWLSPIVEYVLKAILIPDFNQHFQGITLPTVIENVIINVTPGNLILALNANIA